jgi:hypothetical protein
MAAAFGEVVISRASHKDAGKPCHLIQASICVIQPHYAGSAAAGLVATNPKP